MGLIPKPNLKKLVSHIERAAEGGVKKIAPANVRRSLVEIYEGFDKINPIQGIRRVTKELEKTKRRGRAEPWQAERPKTKKSKKGK